MEGDATRGRGGMNGEQGEQLKHAVTGLADQATRTAEARASTTMTKAGEALHEVAGAIRRAGDDLRADQPEVAGFVDTAATTVEDAASYLREHDAGEAVAGIQDFARNQPALVIGGGLALGLLLGRFLRSGAAAADGRQRFEPQASGAMGDRGASARFAAGRHGSGGYGTSYGSDADETRPRSGYGSTATGHGSAAEEAGHGTTFRDATGPTDLDTTSAGREPLADEVTARDRGR
jgi:hypothetical protein